MGLPPPVFRLDQLFILKISNWKTNCSMFFYDEREEHATKKISIIQRTVHFQGPSKVVLSTEWDNRPQGRFPVPYFW